MKQILILISILSLISTIKHFQKRKENKDICYTQNGCKFALKNMIFLPILDELGERNEEISSNFDYKVIIAFFDHLAIFETDQEQIFNRDKKLGKFLRNIYFDQFQLNCGEDQNKLCTIKEFKELNPDFKLNEVILYFSYCNKKKKTYKIKFVHFLLKSLLNLKREK